MILRLSLLFLLTATTSIFCSTASTADTLASESSVVASDEKKYQPIKLHDCCIAWVANNFSEFDHESNKLTSCLHNNDLERILQGAAVNRRNAADLCRYKENCHEQLIEIAQLLSNEAFTVGDSNKDDVEFAIEQLQLTDPELLTSCAQKQMKGSIDNAIAKIPILTNPTYRMHIFNLFNDETSCFMYGLLKKIKLELVVLKNEDNAARIAYYHEKLKNTFDYKHFEREDFIKRSLDLDIQPLFDQVVLNHKTLMVERIGKVLKNNGKEVFVISDECPDRYSIKQLRKLWAMAIKISIANSKSNVDNLVHELSSGWSFTYMLETPLVGALKEFLEIKASKYADPDEGE